MSSSERFLRSAFFHVRKVITPLQGARILPPALKIPKRPHSSSYRTKPAAFRPYCRATQPCNFGANRPFFAQLFPVSPVTAGPRPVVAAVGQLLSLFAGRGRSSGTQLPSSPQPHFAGMWWLDPALGNEPPPATQRKFVVSKARTPRHRPVRSDLSKPPADRKRQPFAPPRDAIVTIPRLTQLNHFASFQPSPAWHNRPAPLHLVRRFHEFRYTRPNRKRIALPVSYLCFGEDT
jgi:hypothetical protein